MKSLLGVLLCVGFGAIVLYSADFILGFVSSSGVVKPWVAELLSEEIPFLATTGGLARLSGRSTDLSES